jgi:hypothetical protein
MINTFSKASLQQQFQQEGYLVVSLLSSSEVNNLYHEVAALLSEKNSYFTTFASPDFAHRKRMDEAIKSAFKPFVDQHLFYKPFWGNLFPKNPGSPAMPLHADWTYVHEPEHTSINIWCPLVDTTITNGAFGIVPRSHKIINQIRGINLPRFYANDEEEIIKRFGKTLELKAGEAIIYDHRMLHYSLPNQTDSPRLAATLVCLPHDATIIHYYAPAEGADISLYELPDHHTLLQTPFFAPPYGLSPVHTFKAENFRLINAVDFENL